MAVILKLPGEVVLQDSALPGSRPDGYLHITVGKYRPGRAKLTQKQAEQLADVLNEWIIGGSEYPNS